jgi:predicted RNase H-like nuclease (RuvC/YqgF family)
MTYDKTKALEASIFDAIKKHDCDPSELMKFAEECFISRRARVVNENQLKNYQNLSKSLEEEIFRYKTCIANLRGYIDYLETENGKLERKLEEN